jgi:hypothetical protein
MKSLNSTLEALQDKLAAESGTTEFLLVHRAWKKAVGALVANRAFVYRYDRGTVFIGATDSSWVQELLLKKHHWIENLRQATGLPINEMLFFPKELPNGAHRPVDTRR